MSVFTLFQFSILYKCNFHSKHFKFIAVTFSEIAI